MIINLLNRNYRFWWIMFHIMLGIAAVFNNLYIIIWFYFILATTFYLLAFTKLNTPLLLASTMVYLGAFELIARMTKCSPFIPWEASKYIFTVLSIIGILFTFSFSRKKIVGFLIIMLTIPAILIDKSEMAKLNDIIFNVLGIINIGLGLIFFSALTIKKSRYIDLFSLLIYPCIAVLTYTFIKTPDLQDINFSLGALTATSGEFGSNQVSTVFGLGFLLMSMACVLDWKMLGSKIIDGLVAVAFLIQGLFTFSRGGMIGGGLALLLFLYFLIYKNQHASAIPKSVKRYSIPALIVFFLAINYANELTGGKLLFRYQGETEGTLRGSRDRDLNTLTSNRNLIFFSDIELWLENPVLGSGAGSSKYLRAEGQGTAAHIELSRLLAEQGLPGLIIFLLILYSGYNYFKETDSVLRAIKVSIFVLAIFTTFHSATRTFVTPILISLCAINVWSPKTTYDSLSRK